MEAQTRLSGETGRLTTEKAELADLLAQEQQWTRMLEAQLQEQLQQKEKELSGIKEAYENLVTELQTEIFHKDVTLRQVKQQLTITIVNLLTECSSPLARPCSLQRAPCDG